MQQLLFQKREDYEMRLRQEHRTRERAKRIMHLLNTSAQGQQAAVRVRQHVMEQTQQDVYWFSKKPIDEIVELLRTPFYFEGLVLLADIAQLPCENITEDLFRQVDLQQFLERRETAVQVLRIVAGAVRKTWVRWLCPAKLVSNLLQKAFRLELNAEILEFAANLCRNGAWVLVESDSQLIIHSILEMIDHQLFSEHLLGLRTVLAKFITEGVPVHEVTERLSVALLEQQLSKQAVTELYGMARRLPRLLLEEDDQNYLPLERLQRLCEYMAQQV